MIKNASQSAISLIASSARLRPHARSAQIITPLQRIHSLVNPNAQLDNSFPMEFADLAKVLSNPARNAAMRRRN